MHSDGVPEVLALHSDVVVLDRDHLVEVDSVSAWLGRLVVAKPGSGGTERLEMVSSGQLVVQHLELVLNLGVVSARARAVFSILADLVEEVTFHRRVEAIRHEDVRHSWAATNLLENSGLLLGLLVIGLVRVGRWASSGVSDRSSDGARSEDGRQFGEVLLLCGLLVVVGVRSWNSQSVLGRSQRIPADLGFESHVSLIDGKR